MISGLPSFLGGDCDDYYYDDDDDIDMLGMVEWWPRDSFQTKDWSQSPRCFEAKPNFVAFSCPLDRKQLEVTPCHFSARAF